MLYHNLKGDIPLKEVPRNCITRPRVLGHWNKDVCSSVQKIMNSLPELCILTVDVVCIESLDFSTQILS